MPMSVVPLIMPLWQALHKKATVHMHPSLHAGELDIIDCQMLHTESTACSFKKQGCQSSDAAQ